MNGQKKKVRVRSTGKEEEEEKENMTKQQTTSCSRNSSPSTSLSSSSSSSSDEREYQMQELRDRLKSSRGSRFDLIEKEFQLNSGWSKFSRKALLHDFVIHPDNRFVCLTSFPHSSLSPSL